MVRADFPEGIFAGIVVFPPFDGNEQFAVGELEGTHRKTLSAAWVQRLGLFLNGINDGLSGPGNGSDNGPGAAERELDQQRTSTHGHLNWSKQHYPNGDKHKAKQYG